MKTTHRLTTKIRLIEMSEGTAKIRKKLEELETRIAKIENLILINPKIIEKKLSTKEFILKKHPRNDVEKALGIAYYLEKFKGLSSFNAIDVENGFRDAREKVPSNVVALNFKLPNRNNVVYPYDAVLLARSTTIM